MKQSVKLGMNKTGLGLAPKMAAEMLDNQDDAFKAFAQAPDDPIPTQDFKDIRQDYAREWGAIGTLPPPATVRGAVATGIEKIMARNPEVLIDKLGERLAFERSGSRLYDAFITKCEVALPDASLDFLHEIRDDEIRHFELVQNAIVELGADPTAMTPCADVAGVASKGLIDVVNDPRTSVAQAAQAILIAELTDNDGWATLITLVDQAGLKETAAKFREAKEAEERHLMTIRTWFNQLTMANNAVEYDPSAAQAQPTVQ